jgi:hypothetical protein
LACRQSLVFGVQPALAIPVRPQATLSTRLARLLGCKLVGGALLMCGLPAFASRLARLGRRELMGSSLGMGCFASLACDLALLFGVHSSEATVALFWHN